MIKGFIPFLFFQVLSGKENPFYIVKAKDQKMFNNFCSFLLIKLYTQILL